MNQSEEHGEEMGCGFAFAWNIDLSNEGGNISF